MLAEQLDVIAFTVDLVRWPGAVKLGLITSIAETAGVWPAGVAARRDTALVLSGASVNV